MQYDIYGSVLPDGYCDFAWDSVDANHGLGSFVVEPSMSAAIGLIDGMAFSDCKNAMRPFRLVVRMVATGIPQAYYDLPNWLNFYRDGFANGTFCWKYSSTGSCVPGTSTQLGTGQSEMGYGVRL